MMNSNSGAGENRTRVQTRNQSAFYMFIVFLLSGRVRKNTT